TPGVTPNGQASHAAGNKMIPGITFIRGAGRQKIETITNEKETLWIFYLTIKQWLLRAPPAASDGQFRACLRLRALTGVFWTTIKRPAGLFVRKSRGGENHAVSIFATSLTKRTCTVRFRKLQASVPG